MISSSTVMSLSNYRMGQLYRQREICQVFHFFLKKQAHKLFLAVASPVFEGMFFGPLADKGLREVMRLQMSTFFLALHCIALHCIDGL